MSEPVQATFYGVRAAQDDDLVDLAAIGDDLACDELGRRLPERLAKLFDWYLIAYRQNRSAAIGALGADMDRLMATV